MLFNKSKNKQEMIECIDVAVSDTEPEQKTSRLAAFGKSALSHFKSFQTKVSESIKERTDTFSRNFSAAYKAWQISNKEIALENYEKTMFKKIDKILEYDPDYFQKTHYGNSSMTYLLKRYEETHKPEVAEDVVKKVVNAKPAMENIESPSAEAVEKMGKAVSNTEKSSIPPVEVKDSKSAVLSPVEVMPVSAQQNVPSGESALKADLGITEQPANAPSTIKEKTEQLETAAKHGSNTYINGLHTILNTVAEEINKWQNADNPEDKANFARNIEIYMNKGLEGMNAVRNHVRNNIGFDRSDLVTDAVLSDDAKRNLITEAQKAGAAEAKAAAGAHDNIDYDSIMCDHGGCPGDDNGPCY